MLPYYYLKKWKEERFMNIMSSVSLAGTLAVVAAVLAVVATVLAFVFLVPEKRREKMGNFGKFLHDTVNFKYLIVEKILQALYIFLTCFVILSGFFLLFKTVDTWEGKYWLGGQGLLLMILGPIVIRLVYELLMMMVLLVKNVIAINGKLRSQNGDTARKDVFAAPSLDMSGMKARILKNTVQDNGATMAPQAPQGPVVPQSPVAPQAPAARFCPKCGTPLENGVCPNCGHREI